MSTPVPTSNDVQKHHRSAPLDTVHEHQIHGTPDEIFIGERLGPWLFIDPRRQRSDKGRRTDRQVDLGPVTPQKPRDFRFCETPLPTRFEALDASRSQPPIERPARCREPADGLLHG